MHKYTTFRHWVGAIRFAFHALVQALDRNGWAKKCCLNCGYWWMCYVSCVSTHFLAILICFFCFNFILNLIVDRRKSIENENIAWILRCWLINAVWARCWRHPCAVRWRQVPHSEVSLISSVLQVEVSAIHSSPKPHNKSKSPPFLFTLVICWHSHWPHSWILDLLRIDECYQFVKLAIKMKVYW